MTKPLFQDIIPPDKRSITRVPIPNRSGRNSRHSVENISTNEGPIRHLSVPDDENTDIRQPSSKNAESRANIVQPTQPTIDTPRTSFPANFNTNTNSVDRQYTPPSQRIPFYEEGDPYRRRFPWKALIVLICAVVIIIGTYLVLSHFAKATVTITPQTETLAVNQQFTGILLTTATTSSATTTLGLSQSTTAPTLSPGQVPYQVITLTKDGAMTVASSGQTPINTKATGSIIIFNDYSTAPQKLIKDTRFSTPNGLIYRIDTPVTIPGKKGTTPGSVTVTVTADNAGANYNIGLSDFVVPGLSGTAAYKSIYARSKTAMTGGFSGIQPTINTATLDAADATIDAELEGVLLQQIRQEIPQNEILLSNAYVVNYRHLLSTAASSSQAVVHEEGTINAFAINATDLANAIAETASTSTSSAVTANKSVTTWQINDPSQLQFSFATSSDQTASPWELSSTPFTITGTANLLATIDTQKIKENLAGKPRSDFTPILTSFPAVSKATMNIQPFWKQSFPTNLEKITINIEK